MKSWTRRPSRPSNTEVAMVWMFVSHPSTAPQKNSCWNPNVLTLEGRAFRRSPNEWDWYKRGTREHPCPSICQEAATRTQQPNLAGILILDFHGASRAARNTFLWFISQAAYGILLYQPELIYTTLYFTLQLWTHTHTHPMILKSRLNANSTEEETKHWVVQRRGRRGVDGEHLQHQDGSKTL